MITVPSACVIYIKAILNSKESVRKSNKILNICIFSYPNLGLVCLLNNPTALILNLSTVGTAIYSLLAHISVVPLPQLPVSVPSHCQVKLPLFCWVNLISIAYLSSLVCMLCPCSSWLGLSHFFSNAALTVWHKPHFFEVMHDSRLIYLRKEVHVRSSILSTNPGYVHFQLY